MIEANARNRRRKRRRVESPDDERSLLACSDGTGTEQSFFEGEGRWDSGTQRPPMPMPSATKRSKGCDPVGLFGTGEDAIGAISATPLPLVLSPAYAPSQARRRRGRMSAVVVR